MKVARYVLNERCPLVTEASTQPNLKQLNISVQTSTITSITQLAIHLAGEESSPKSNSGACEPRK